MTETLDPSGQRPAIAATMRALRLEGRSVALDGKARVPTLQAEDDVLVRLSVAGLCRTDLYVADGSLGAKDRVILGHEASGVVVRAGHGTGIEVGDLVSFDPRIPCDACATCGAKRAQRCLTPTRLGVERDGVFAEYVVVPRSTLVALDPSIPHQRAAYFEPVAAALGALEAPEDPAVGAIVGTGRIALLTARLMGWAGRRVPRVLDLDGLRDSGERFDFLIDAGLPDEGALWTMTEALLPGGTLVLKSRAVDRHSFTPADWVNRDLRVVARSYGDFERAAGALADPALLLEDLFGPIYPLEAYADAFRDARASEGVKQFLNLGDTH